MSRLVARWPLLSHLAAPAGISAVLAGVNVVLTIVIVRSLGDHAYADFAVDLALVSLTLVALEVVPSSYTVFRLQDDSRWRSTLGPQTLLGFALTAVMLGLLCFSVQVFAAFSAWVFVYTLAVALKRHLDLVLQSTGRLAEFLAIDLLAATLRLPLLFAFQWAGASPATVLWASLSLGLLVAQAVWVWRDRTIIYELCGATRSENWGLLWAERTNFSTYYLNTALKRIRDSLATILAAWVIADKSELAAFLLAYRGVLAATSQARLVEAVLNHRRTREEVAERGATHRWALALGVQLLCLAASVFIALAVGIDQPPWLVMGILSALAWPITYMMLERARAYAAFRARHVASSLSAYILVVMVGATLFLVFDTSTAWLFSSLLLLADTASWYAISRANSRGRVPD